MTDADLMEQLARRNPVPEDMREDLAVRVEQLRPPLPPRPPRGTTLERPSRRSRRSHWQSRPTGAALLLGTVVAATLVVLTVASPWQAGASALDRAAAAIAAPTPNHVLRQAIALHAGPFNRRGAVNVHIWVSRTPPRRFRVTFAGLDGRVEYGGTLGGRRGLAYDAADGVLDPLVFGAPLSESDLDPVAFVKTALASGRARSDGATTIRGQRVLRIRIPSRFSRTGAPVAFYFVDAHTYRPVRLIIPAGFRPGIPPGVEPSAFAHEAPLLFLTLPPGATPSGPMSIHYALIYDFADYRYLAPTAANRKLANVRAQHAQAKIV